MKTWEQFIQQHSHRSDEFARGAATAWQYLQNEVNRLTEIKILEEEVLAEQFQEMNEMSNQMIESELLRSETERNYVGVAHE